jgi:c-di-GMP-binding flagellar brake protein YcgR
MILDIPGVTERRQSPRYDIALSVDFVLDDGSILTVDSRNISSSGLQVICDGWVTDQLEPRGIQTHSISHIRFKAIIELPVGDEKLKLYSRCRIMSVQRLSLDVYMLNLAFIDFENGTEKVLDDFIDQYEQKKTVIKATA